MLKKIFIAFLLIAISVVYANAESTNVSDANITGHVVDKDTGEHIPGCLVVILNSEYATMTDASGHYIFRDLSPGEYEIQVSFMGYLTQKKSTSVTANKTVELNFEVEEDAFMLDQVVVTSSKTETPQKRSVFP